MATVAMLLVFFSTGFVLEMMLIYEGTQGGAMSSRGARSTMQHMRPLHKPQRHSHGCLGGPFEVSKRKRIPFLITLRVGNAFCEMLASGAPAPHRMACMLGMSHSPMAHALLSFQGNNLHPMLLASS